MAKIEAGDKVRISENLPEVLENLGFDSDAVENAHDLVGTEQTVYSVWQDSDGTTYATIDMCVEVPLQCCEALA